MPASQIRKKEAMKKALLFGLASLSLYIGVFIYAEPLTSLFARGGMYSLLPVISVFLFSYVHASFAGNVWTALGIEASPTAGGSDTAQSAAKGADKEPCASVRV